MSFLCFRFDIAVSLVTAARAEERELYYVFSLIRLSAFFLISEQR